VRVDVEGCCGVGVSEATGDSADGDAGGEEFERLRAMDRNHQIEKVGADLRAKMPFLNPVVVEAGQAQAVASQAPAANPATKTAPAGAAASGGTN